MASLYALRFFVSIGIYLHHLSYPWGLGTLGVTFFFVISGFASAYSLNQGEFNINKNFLKQYYCKKILKIYPLYLITFIMSIPVLNYTNFRFDGKNVIIHLLMLQSYYPSGKEVFLFNGLSWFVSDIMLFYLVTPFIFLAAKKIKKRNNFIYLLTSIVLLMTAALLAYSLKDKLSPVSTVWWFIYISPYFRIFDYIIGFMIGMVFTNIKDKIHTNIKTFSLFSVLEISSVIIGYILIRSPYVRIMTIRYGVYFIPIVATVIFTFAFGQGIISKILSFKPLIYCGKLSFVIFMIHQLVISYASILIGSSFFNKNKTTFNNLKPAIFLFFIILCISDVIYRYFMPTSNKLLTTKFNLKKLHKHKSAKDPH